MVPMDQPKAALEMLRHWTKGNTLDDSSEMLEIVTKTAEETSLH